MKIKSKIKRILSGVMAAAMAFSLIPSMPAVHAAQNNAYVDPADVWLKTNNRTSELDANAIVTYVTANCPVCGQITPQTSYRVPEYTRSGETALNRGVLYSDGTCMDGESKGNLDDGVPGIDAFYTGYHWTKSVCEVCGTLNVIDGESSYSFGKDVYSLHACDNNFFLDFDNTTHRPYDSENHTTTLKKGKYCQFCKGTYARAENKQEPHEITEIVDAQLGNQRFHVTGECEDCGFIENEYAVAKAIVQSYYGIADGSAHTITLSDLSDADVNTSIRYGESANKCNLTSAPNYTEAGYYPVYYEITYRYADASMKENGVSYVWLLADNSSSKVQSDTATPHVHDYRFLETVRPTCTELGYDRFQCSICGALQKTNYVPALGHDYQTVVIREASCQQGGLELHSCNKCGAFYTESTSMTNHKYQTADVAATCTTNGYTEHKCIDCGYKHVTDLTPLAKHDYRTQVTEPTCTGRGFTTYICSECGDTYVSDYKDATGHEWDNGHEITHATCNGEGLLEYNCKHCDATKREAKSATGHTPGAAATCTEPQTCTVCGAILELPKGHHYSEAVTVPTCTTMGFTTYTCDDCGKSYVGNYTDKTEHHYDSVITPATCTAMGYTTYTCTECGNEYTSDYVDKKLHNYQAEITPATCTTMGYITYTCADCEDSYVADYTDVLPHNYTKQVVPPTCTSQGYTIYTCPDCGKEYIGDEKESVEHNYTSVVTPPTCTELGYTTITCSVCGETHKINYVAAAGHKPSDWIIDTLATIERSGSKHKECTVCGTTLETAEIPQLADKDNSDEDGHSKVGDYSILITDKNNKPIFNSEISIDKNDNITIKLPDGRLLSADDITTITVTNSETQQPVEGISIFVADTSNNAATGKTDANGQLKVPNASSSTGDSNGTVADKDNTYVVVVTDKNGELITDCGVTVGDNYSINVKLPAGTPFDKDNRVTVTVVTETGEPVNGLRVQLIGDADFIENGYTNIKGQITLPVSNTDITDDNGNGEVGDKDGEKVYDYIVTVSDENGLVKDAIITLIAKDEAVLVCLPEGKVIDYYNRTTVKVMRSDGTPVKDWKVSVYNKDGSGLRTELTDEDGIVVVPPLSEAPLAKPTPTPNPDTESNPLPGVETTPKPDVTEKPSETAKPTEKPSEPTQKPTPSENPSETTKPTETPKPTDTPNPDETAKPTEKPSEPTPTPDMGDGAVVQNKNYKYRVFVWDTAGVITEFGLVKLQDDGNLEIELPENKTLNPENKVNIRVINENDGSPVKGITVTVTDINGGTASDITNSAGIAIVPVSDTDITDANGNAQVKDENGNMYNVNVATETKGNIEGAEVKIADGKITVTLPDGTVIDYADRTTVTVADKDNAPVKDMSVNVKDSNGGDRTGTTNADGKVVVPPLSENFTDKDGKTVVDGYTVVVEDTKAKIENAYVEIKDGKINVKLPDANELATSNQTTVTVTDKDAKAVKDMSVTITDKNNATAADMTNTSGKVTLPKKSSSGGGGGGSSSSGGSSGGGGGGGSVTVTTTYNVKVTDKDGKTVSVTKSVKDGKITLTLPNGKTIDSDNYYTIVVTDKNNKPAPNIDVTLKDKKGNTANGITDANGKLVLPAVEHKSYIVGYEDGSFMPEGNMTRAEVAAIFARNIADRKGETIPHKNSSFKDVNPKLWYNDTIAYLKKYDIVVGYADGTFKPEEFISRAEFVAMCSRFYTLTDKITAAKTSKFTDVKSGHWAYQYIIDAAAMDWIAGYADNTFRPDAQIKRAEVVAIVNRMTGRKADRDFVNANMSKINPFTDMNDSVYWAFYDVIEAANTHMAVESANGEVWTK